MSKGEWLPSDPKRVNEYFDQVFNPPLTDRLRRLGVKSLKLSIAIAENDENPELRQTLFASRDVNLTELKLGVAMFEREMSEQELTVLTATADADAVSRIESCLSGLTPPALPEYRPSLLLDLLVPFDRAQDMHANLGEIYPLWVERYGPRKAAVVRALQIWLLIGGTWWEKLLSTGERLLKSARLIGS